MPSYDHTPYDAPDAPSMWRRKGVIPLNRVVIAMDLLIVRGSVKGIAKLYRRRIEKLQASLENQAAAWILEKLTKDVLKRRVLAWATQALSIFKERRFQEEARERLRAAFLKEAKQMWEARLQRNAGHKKKKRKVKTRRGHGFKAATRGAQLEINPVIQARGGFEG